MKHSGTFKYLQICIILMLNVSLSYSQVTVYIDFANTSDTEQDGTIDHPYDGFENACSRASAAGIPLLDSNTEYLIKRGSVFQYESDWAGSSIMIEDTNISIGAYGTGDKPFFGLFAVYGGGTNVTIENLQVSSYAGMSFSNGSDITIRNCIIRDSEYPAFSNSSNVLVEDCEIYSIDQDGMWISDCDSVVLRRVNIHDINLEYVYGGYGQGDGIQMSGTNNFYMFDCIIDRSNSGNKFCIIAAGGENYYIEGCHFIGPNQHIRETQDVRGSIMHLGVSDVTFYGNIFENSPIAINVKSSICNIYYNLFLNNDVAIGGGAEEVFNNVFYNNGSVGNSETFSNNIIYMSDESQVGLTYGSFNEANSNITNIRGAGFYAGQSEPESSVVVIADPLFVDPAIGDFHLQPSSHGINNGSDLGLSLDFDGNPVPSTPNIGIFEDESEYNLLPQADISNGDTLWVDPGESFVLNGTGSSDPDGDDIDYYWYTPPFAKDDLGNEEAIVSGSRYNSTFEITAPDMEIVFRASLKVFDGTVYSSPDIITIIVGDGKEYEELDPNEPIVFNNDFYGINCGGLDYTSTEGKVYYSDRYFEGGDRDFENIFDISGTTEDTLYSQQRMSNCGYHIPIANGTYLVKIRFYERFFATVGQRVFNVYMEDRLDPVFDRIDIYAQSGGMRTALDIEGVVEITDNNLFIETVGINEYPVLSAIEIQPYIVTNISSSEKEKSTKLYPIPVRNSLVLNSDCLIEEVKIYNSNGQLVKSFGEKSDFKALNVNDLSNGMYLLKIVYSDNSIETKKIVK
jgi:hypothetical protein